MDFGQNLEAEVSAWVRILWSSQRHTSRPYVTLCRDRPSVEAEIDQKHACPSDWRMPQRAAKRGRLPIVSDVSQRAGEIVFNSVAYLGAYGQLCAEEDSIGDRLKNPLLARLGGRVTGDVPPHELRAEILAVHVATLSEVAPEEVVQDQHERERFLHLQQLQSDLIQVQHHPDARDNILVLRELLQRIT